MRSTPRSLLALVLTTAATACVVGETPPPPELRVTSPARGLVQSGGGQVTVSGSARPGASGAAVARVRVNGVPAALSPDGSFTAVVDVPAGATLLETVATSDEGGVATDARSVQVGELRPVGSSVERAVTASLSAETFARLASAAGPLVASMDLGALLAPMQPMADLGDSIANVKVSIKRLTLGDVRFTLVPVEGGLAFRAEFDALDVGADAAYGGALVIDGTTAITATADTVTIAGTLIVTPAGTDGFTISIASPVVDSRNLRLDASGIAGDIVDLLQDNLRSTIAKVVTRSAETALTPLLNQAFGALAGEQQFEVLGERLALQASPAAVAFSPAGALVTIHLAARIGGSESSPGYIYTPNGAPPLTIGDGLQVGLADDLVNQLLAQVHATGLLDLHVEEDVGIFDTVDVRLSVPPMVSADGTDGAMRLVLGDMIASFTDDGTEVFRAALNASVDLQVDRGRTADELALQFGKVRMFVNVLDTADGTTPGDPMGASDAAAAGIAVQLDSMSQFLINVPVPSVAGVTLDSLELHADSGYVVMSGALH